MGLFGSSKEVYVGTSISRVIPDDSVPNSVKTGLLKGLFDTADNSIVDHVLEDMISSLGSRAEKYYAYGRDHYYYGLPAKETLSSTQGAAEVEAVIEAQEAQQVVMRYTHLGPYNLIHFAWKTLVESYGYNYATNEIGFLSAQEGKVVKLKDIKVVLTQAEFDTLSPLAFEVKGDAPNNRETSEQQYSIPGNQADLITVSRGAPRYSPYELKSTANPKYIKVVGVYSTTEENVYVPGADNYQTITTFTDVVLTFPITGEDEDKEYFYAHYTVNGVSKFWTYEIGSGVHPTLDVLLDAPLDPSGTYFPVLHFRYNFQSMAKSEGLDNYASSAKLAKKLGLDFDYLVASIHENPGISDIIQSALLFAVPANSTDQIDLRYLFDYFSEQYGLQNPVGTSKVVYERSRIGGTARNVTLIKDARFKFSLANDGIFKKIVPGKIGEVGTYTTAYGEAQVPYTAYDSESGQEYTAYAPVKSHLYRKQITASSYEELEVVALRSIYHIGGKYAEIGKNGSKILLVPVDRSISTEYSLPHREKLYARAMHFIFNSYVEVKLEWYQQEWFQVVMIVVAIVVIVLTYGAAWQAYAAAVAAGTVTITALLYGLIITALKYLVYAAAIKYFIKSVGAEAAFAIAILATFAAMMGQFNPAMMAGVSSQSLLSFATNLTQVAQEVLAEDFEALAEEKSEFDQEMSKQMKTLETAEELLERTFPLNPLTLFNESPDAFYNRTVHSGNIGLVGISAVSNYVDAALTLPTIDQTIGA